MLQTGRRPAEGRDDASRLQPITLTNSRKVEGVGEVQRPHVARPRDGVQHAHGANHGRADGDQDDERHEGAVVAGPDTVAGPAKKSDHKEHNIVTAAGACKYTRAGSTR